MIRSLRLDIRQSHDLAVTIYGHIDQQRFAYNVAVEATLRDPAMSFFRLCKMLTALRRGHEWLGAGDARIQRAGMALAVQAVRKFRESNDIKRGRRGRRRNRWRDPHSLFRSKKSRRPRALVVFMPPVLRGNMIFLPGIGEVEPLGDIPEGADLRSFQLVETTKRVTRRTRPQDRTYRLHTQIRTDSPEPTKSGVIRGVDLGIIHGAVSADSTGAVSYHDIPDNCKRMPNDGIDRMKSRQSGRKKNSRSWRGTARRMSAKLEKLRNRQTNAERHIAKEVTDGLGTLAVDDLKASNMTRRGRGKRGLNRSMSYARLAALRARMERTAENRGVEVETVSGRNTSIACNACKHIDKNSRRTQSEFVCVRCGHEDNADANAARNILSLVETRRQGVSSLDARAQAGFAPGRSSALKEAVRETSTGGSAGASEKGRAPRMPSPPRGGDAHLCV